MLNVTVKSSMGKDVGITMFGDGFLFFAMPITILSCLWMFFVRPLVLALRKLALTPVKKLLFILLNNGWLSIPALFIAWLIVVPTLYLVNKSFADSTILFAAGIFFYYIITGMIFLLLENYSQPDSALLGLERCEAIMAKTFQSISNNMPEGIDIADDSKPVVAHYFMLSIVALTCLFFTLLTADVYSWLFWVFFISLISLALTTDFEPLEHIASHSAKGEIFRLKRHDLRSWLFVGLNLTRKYVLWNVVFLWPADRYYYIHTQHHIENNGPADWQSTLRFNQTSILDFCKAIGWFTITVIPFETWKYLESVNKKTQLKSMLIGHFFNYTIFLALFFYFPLTVGILSLLALLAYGAPLYWFIFLWHGFHDKNKPHSVEFSNNVPSHYVHHKKPGLHLTRYEEINNQYGQYAQKHPEKVRVHRQFWMLSTYDWLLIRSLFWQGKILHIRNLVTGTEYEPNTYLLNYIQGLNLLQRGQKMRRLDRAISNYLGRLIEKSVLPFCTDTAKQLCYEKKYQEGQAEPLKTVG